MSKESRHAEGYSIVYLGSDPERWSASPLASSWLDAGGGKTNPQIGHPSVHAFTTRPHQNQDRRLGPLGRGHKADMLVLFAGLQMGPCFTDCMAWRKRHGDDTPLCSAAKWAKGGGLILVRSVSVKRGPSGWPIWDWFCPLPVEQLEANGDADQRQDRLPGSTCCNLGMARLL